MKIRKKRIRSLGANLSFVEPGGAITPSFSVTEATRVKLMTIGFEELTPGITVLPKAVGPVSKFNAEGKEIKLRHLPMETVYYEHEWLRVEFHGQDRVEVEETVEVPRRRYQREFVPPPSVELSVKADLEGKLYIVAETHAYTPENEVILLHTINLFLELFGECEILKDDLTAFVSGAIRRVNWEILPKGKLPWDRISDALKPVIERARGRSRPPVVARLKTLNQHQPDFHAVGRGGFSGYVVFGFERLGLYILECKDYGNATYIFQSNWEALSQLTKAEILNQELHFARLVHRTNWADELRKILQSGEDGKVAA